MRTIKILILSATVFLICGAPDIRFQALLPALINVPNHIQTLAVINRSETSTTVLEKVITAELPNESKIASQSAIEGFAGFLQESNRFTIQRTGKSLSKVDRPGKFPDPLTWEEVAAICNEYGSDGLVALEVFNSDYIIPTNMVIVTTGFRLYDIKEKRIVDQELYRHETYWGGPVNTVAGAINRLVEKDRAIKDASYQAGVVYAQRITPTWFPVVRQYYRRAQGNPDLKIGARMMEVNNWDAAIESLTAAVNSGKRKTRGRAAHNLAVVYEILGDLETAKLWAQDAWGKYRNKGSKNYSFILGQRISEQRVLEYQETK